jgi:hypothetical protein
MRPTIVAVATLALVLTTAPAVQAQMDNGEGFQFRSTGERQMLLQAESVRIQARNFRIQQQTLMRMQQANNLNNVIIINQSGSGSVAVRDNVLTGTPTQSINNQMGRIPGGLD